MQYNLAVREFLVECEIKNYTKKTLKSYRNNLEYFGRWFGMERDLSELNLPIIKLFIKNMRGKKATYINSILKVLKSFITYHYDTYGIGWNTKANYVWLVEDKPVIKAFSKDEVRLLLSSCSGNKYTDIRDMCILTMLFETGIRCWELCCINIQDIHNDCIIIHGKNHKQRSVPISPILKKTMLRYEKCKESYFQYKSIDEYYFLSFHGRQLTNGAVEHVLKARGDKIVDKRVSPHTCRHTYAQQLLKQGVDIYSISRLLGHENIQITQTYLRSLSDEEIVKDIAHNSILGNLK